MKDEDITLMPIPGAEQCNDHKDMAMSDTFRGCSRIGSLIMRLTLF